MRNRFKLSKINKVWLSKDDYPHDKNVLPISKVSSPVRQIIIEKNFWPQLVKLMDISDVIKIKAGTAIHKDRAYAMGDSEELTNGKSFDPLVLIEKRYNYILNGIKLSGQPDMIAPETFFPILSQSKCNKIVIEDLKCTSFWRIVYLQESIPDWKLQLSGYKYLLYMQKPPILTHDKGIVSVLCWDLTETQAEKHGLKNCVIQEAVIDLYPIDEIQKILWDKIELLKPHWNCKDPNQLPKCSHEEKNKFGKYKDGVPKKCKTYCNSRFLCDEGFLNG